MSIYLRIAVVATVAGGAALLAGLGWHALWGAALATASLVLHRKDQP